MLITSYSISDNPAPGEIVVIKTVFFPAIGSLIISILLGFTNHRYPPPNESIQCSLFTNGVSVVFTSHDMEEVHKLAHRLILIDAGRIVAEGTPDELCLRYETEDLEELYIALTQTDSDPAGGRSA